MMHCPARRQAVDQHEGNVGGPLGQRAGIGWLGRRSGLFNLLPARLT
jgi:hypothetical protein